MNFKGRLGTLMGTCLHFGSIVHLDELIALPYPIPIPIGITGINRPIDVAILRINPGVNEIVGRKHHAMVALAKTSGIVLQSADLIDMSWRGGRISTRIGSKT